MSPWEEVVHETRSTQIISIMIVFAKMQVSSIITTISVSVMTEEMVLGENVFVHIKHGTRHL
jgi:hydrogenase maturation factor